MININYNTLKEIRQLGNEYFYIYKYKIIKFTKNKVSIQSQHSIPILWKTGKVIWSDKV